MDIIPLSKNYSALFSVEINGEIYDFRTLFNSRAGNWSVDISKDDVYIVNGLPLILGGDIVDQYNFNLDKILMVDLERTYIDADAFDIGERVVMVHVTEEEVDNALTV